MTSSLRNKSILPWTALAGLLLGLPQIAAAGGTQTIEIKDFDDFDEGEAEGAAIEGLGKITVGYATERAEIKAMSAFTCLADGKEAWVGTADAATVQRVKIDKKGVPQVEELAALDGVVVSAMAKLPSGELVAATLPGGKIVRIDKKGKVSDFATLQVEQIWAMTMHPGRLLVATGPKGELYSLDGKGGDAKVILDVAEKNILSLLTVDGEVLAGTSGKAKLYQVTKEVEGRLIHDFKGDELRSMVVTGRNLVVAINAFEESSVSSLQSLGKQLNRSSLTGKGPASTSSSGSAPKATASLHRVDLGKQRDISRASEAAWETWLTKKSQYFTQVVAIDARGTVLVSSSKGGKIYRVRTQRQLATVADLEERQATGLCRLDKGRILATAGDGGAVYRLQSAPAAKASYTSEVFDAKQPADFGSVRVRGSEKGLTIQLRTGPTDEPDARWSQWSTVKLSKRGDGLRGNASVARHRFVQMRALLGSSGAELRDFALFYSPENLAPLVTAVNVDGPEFDVDDDDEPDAEATIKWKVDARDEDDLHYEVKIRAEGSRGKWIRLSEDPTSKKELDFDLSTVPDGVYEVSVIASDEPSNGSARARTDSLTSDPFTIDRTRPSIASAKVEGSRVVGSARDQGSYIHDVSFSVDGGPFRAASASDGMFDGFDEQFEFKLPTDLRGGPHRLVVRVRDAHGNLVTKALEFST
jgi:sugar lactone lactonase YvrE